MAKASMITVSSVFSGVPPLFASLSRIIAGDIDCSQACISAHSVDGSPYMVRPQAVLYPKTTSDLKHAISFAREYSIPLIVSGGMSASSGGSLGEGIVIDMTRYFSAIRHVNMLEHTITVDAGASIHDIRAKLSSWNLEIPVLEDEHSRATIGGLVATKSATSRSFYAGTIRDWVEGITVIVDSGEEHTLRDGITPSGRLLGIYQSVFPLLDEHGPILRAGKRELSDDATGYSLWSTSIGPRQLIDQITGSEGTLAIITSITLRVVPKKLHDLSIVFPVQSYALLETTTAIAKHHQAEALFMFDAAYRKLADTFHPLLIPAGLPEAPLYIIATFRGNDEHALGKYADAFLKALPSSTERHEIPERNLSKFTSYAFLHGLFKDYTKGTHMVATAGEGIIVPFHSYGECVQSLDEHLGKTGRPYALSGYIGSGHLAATTSFDAKSLSYESDLQDYREMLFTIVQTYKGGISAFGGDGLERTAALPMIFNEAVRGIFKKLKQAWDPQDIFNPGKKISITKEYLIKRAARTLE
jgi:FAD/FMN-containing dehydrogenase